jgi:hypothetical protein
VVKYCYATQNGAALTEHTEPLPWTAALRIDGVYHVPLENGREWYALPGATPERVAKHLIRMFEFNVGRRGAA